MINAHKQINKNHICIKIDNRLKSKIAYSMAIFNYHSRMFNYESQILIVFYFSSNVDLSKTTKFVIFQSFY